MSSLSPIPEISIPTFVRSEFVYAEVSSEQLVDICSYSEGIINYQPVYFSKGYNGATQYCYVRESVARMLMDAKRKLPSNYTFLIFDAWRPYSVQKELYDEYILSLKSKPEYCNMDDESIQKVAEPFVAAPSRNKYLAYAHGTGGAVDLTVLDEYAQPLDMGTEFDDFSDKANTAYFEWNNTKLDTEIRDNRRLLYHVMVESGFTNLPSEWWHFDFGDLNWAYLKKCNPIYTTIFNK